MQSDFDENARGTSGAPDDDIRCQCGSLLARWFDDRVELKCRRCKRVVLVDIRGRRVELRTSDARSAARAREK